MSNSGWFVCGVWPRAFCLHEGGESGSKAEREGIVGGAEREDPVGAAICQTGTERSTDRRRVPEQQANPNPDIFFAQLPHTGALLSSPATVKWLGGSVYKYRTSPTADAILVLPRIHTATPTPCTLSPLVSPAS